MLMDIVRELEGKTNEDRRDAIVALLERESIPYEVQEYERRKERASSRFVVGVNSLFGVMQDSSLPLCTIPTGQNILLSTREGDNDFLVFAHYDAVPGSPGANDNASSVAVALDVYKRLRTETLNHRVRIIFSGDEEGSNELHALYGSRQYFLRNHMNQPEHKARGVLSLEMCGMGDMAMLFPVTQKNKGSALIGAVIRACDEKRVGLECTRELPYMFSDDAVFREFGVVDSYCLAAIPSKDKDAARMIVESPMKDWSTWGTPPEILQRYHSVMLPDSSNALSETSLRMMSDIVCATIARHDREGM